MRKLIAISAVLFILTVLVSAVSAGCSGPGCVAAPKGQISLGGSITAIPVPTSNLGSYSHVTDVSASANGGFTYQGSSKTDGSCGDGFSQSLATQPTDSSAVGQSFSTSEATGGFLAGSSVSGYGNTAASIT